MYSLHLNLTMVLIPVLDSHVSIASILVFYKLTLAEGVIIELWDKTQHFTVKVLNS